MAKRNDQGKKLFFVATRFAHSFSVSYKFLKLWWCFEMLMHKFSHLSCEKVRSVSFSQFNWFIVIKFFMFELITFATYAEIIIFNGPILSKYYLGIYLTQSLEFSSKYGVYNDI